MINTTTDSLNESMDTLDFQHFSFYNHAASNLAMYSHETSQDKLQEAQNRQSIILTLVHDKLHEKLFISTCPFLRIYECG